ncbi:GH92 family glycosyl hydrolase [Dactylosporangium vinaceum]|uniref:GH92 family glycosyl hydrolase n=1 Tax=Dactylosporangium vinaceum TaxID=53362 RepID=A0ABV5M741_9ACTN|nr:GH92 family glycosyl hydrolase [Dactylosporangium vinaceum]UAC00620.1 GH92 family glycosyl hydrolase [Dactylosporangium vinaceum]
MPRPLVDRLLAGAGAALLGSTLAVVQFAAPAQAADLNLTQYVNPLIGTDDSNSPNPVGGGAGGSTYPGATVPFGMLQFSPDTPTASPSGYRDKDRTIEEFSLTHFDGAGCANNEDIGLLPVTGALGSSPGTAWTSYASAYTKTNEVAQAGYYKNRLDKYSTNVETTTTTRTGVMRLTFPSNTQSRLLINTSRSATGNRTGNISISGSTATGMVTAGGFCGSSKTYPIYFSIRFDRAPASVGTWNGSTISNGSTSTSGVNTGGFFTWDTTSNATVNAQIGVSFVSAANATANLTAETAGFDTARTNAGNAWNSALNKIQVSGGSATDLQKFYTSLYHVLQSPNVSSDTNGQYRGFDNAIHTATHNVYQNYSGWDIYRSWAALVAFIAPDITSDIMKSMVLDGQQGGLLPKWSQQTNEDFVMTGDPGPIIVGSAYAFGARDFDTAAALQLMKNAVAGAGAQGSPIRGREAEYESKKYISGAPSDSMEYSASDFAIAKFAQSLGDTATYNSAMTRAQYWRNTFNTESQFIHPRNSDGTWPWPLNPAQESPFTEGNAAQYTWMTTYNFGALINLMGGPQTAKQRLDHHFTELNAGLSRPYFYLGNEPEHGVPWAYNFAQYPAGASSAVRRVMSEQFTTGAGGLPGNDDLGATSAWYVWSALGMYPATPGADTLAINGPSFSSILIQRPGGNVTINGGSATSQYVQSVSLNGSAVSKNFIRYPDLAAGGTLTYTMGTSPSSWGTGAGDVPPSFTDGATQPATPPNLGTNLALGKTATGSATCAAAESADKAVDGTLQNNSKFCSSAATKFLQVDLGSNQSVGAVVLKHAGLGAENTGWNTGAFTISTSTDGTNWSTAATVSGNRTSRTLNQFTARTARYVKVDITTPANDGNTAARIYEFEVYGAATGGNLLLNKAATADSSCASTEGPEKAVNGSVSGGNSDKWCSTGASKFLQVDMGASNHLSSIVVRHAGAGGESASWDTKDFDLQTSADGSTWTTVASPRGNTADVTTHAVNVTARYVRLNVITPTQTTDGAARIYELEAYA